MRSVSKIVLLPVMLFVAGALYAGCGGYSQSDAVAYCDIEKSSKGACFNDATYNECVSCFEECGERCAPASACPETYSCPP
jgi:hypothetical protein